MVKNWNFPTTFKVCHILFKMGLIGSDTGTGEIGAETCV